jgi:hypothetical protein
MVFMGMDARILTENLSRELLSCVMCRGGPFGRSAKCTNRELQHDRQVECGGDEVKRSYILYQFIVALGAKMFEIVRHSTLACRTVL